MSAVPMNSSQCAQVRQTKTSWYLRSGARRVFSRSEIARTTGRRRSEHADSLNEQKGKHMETKLKRPIRQAVRLVPSVVNGALVRSAREEIVTLRGCWLLVPQLECDNRRICDGLLGLDTSKLEDMLKTHGMPWTRQAGKQQRRTPESLSPRSADFWFWNVAETCLVNTCHVVFVPFSSG